MVRQYLIALLFFAGSTNNTMTPVACPDLTWLNTIENSIVQNGWKGEIYSYRYKGESVFEIKSCLNCADFINTINNCSGKVICQFGGIAGLNTCPDFYTMATEKKLVWKN